LEIIVVCSSSNNYMYVEFVSLPPATQKDPFCIGDPTTIRTSPVVVAAVVRERERERILQWGSFLWVVLEEGGLCAGGGGGRLSVTVE
jgi:hypothetical protein